MKLNKVLCGSTFRNGPYLVENNHLQSKKVDCFLCGIGFLLEVVSEETINYIFNMF